MESASSPRAIRPDKKSSAGRFHAATLYGPQMRILWTVRQVGHALPSLMRATRCSERCVELEASALYLTRVRSSEALDAPSRDPPVRSVLIVPLPVRVRVGVCSATAAEFTAMS